MPSWPRTSQDPSSWLPPCLAPLSTIPRSSRATMPPRPVSSSWASLLRLSGLSMAFVLTASLLVSSHFTFPSLASCLTICRLHGHCIEQRSCPRRPKENLEIFDPPEAPRRRQRPQRSRCPPRLRRLRLHDWLKRHHRRRLHALLIAIEVSRRWMDTPITVQPLELLFLK